ncbi:MAG: hypothetical protein KY475_19225 [Planctomycetes bacterium]|nr:hypothetical protein [Planctomycetota bacterium]
MRLAPFFLIAALVSLGCQVSTAFGSEANEPHRSPADVVLAPDDSWLVSVNQTSDTASLVRTSDGTVLDEVAVGERPVFAALHPDGKRVLVSGSYSGDVTMLEVAGDKLKIAATIDVGFEPWGIAVSPDGREAYVAQWAADAVAVVDLAKANVVAQIDVGRRPRFLALSPDGSRLAVSVSGDRGVAVVDPIARKLLYQQRFGGLNIGHLAASRDGEYAYFPWMTYRDNPITPGNIRLGWVLASRIARVRLDADERRSPSIRREKPSPTPTAWPSPVTRSGSWFPPPARTSCSCTACGACRWRATAVPITFLKSCSRTTIASIAFPSAAGRWGSRWREMTAPCTWPTTWKTRCRWSIWRSGS